MRNKRVNKSGYEPEEQEKEVYEIVPDEVEAYEDVLFDELDVEGMTLVDAFYVEDHIVDYYLDLRERYAKEIAKVYVKHGYNASRDWAGTEDGEAVLALDQNGEVVAFIHLDPYETDRLKEAEDEGKLEEEIEKSLPKTNRKK